MATTPNMKFWYVIVMNGYETLFQKKCLDVKEANELLKAKKEEYPKNAPGFEYQVTKEQF